MARKNDRNPRTIPGGARAAIKNDGFAAQDETPELPSAEGPKDQEEFPDWDQMMGPRRRPTSPGGNIFWGGGVLLLAVLLVAQVLYFRGRQLAQDEVLRPWLESACRTVGCKLPVFQAPQRIKSLAHRLQPAPNGVEGLELALVLSNQASLPQAFPDLELILESTTGAAAAYRIFRPPEYLPQQASGLMEVGKPYEIRLLLAKPQREIGGFSFELL